MLVAVLHRLEGTPEPSQKEDFLDVPQDAWYGSAADWAAQEGITVGTGEGAFSPDLPITREMLAVMLYRYAGSPQIAEGAQSVQFTDLESISAWAQDAVEWACDTGVLMGDPQGTLRPQANSTRAEVATMLERFVANSLE
jgi:hypothetical protein